MNWIVLIIAFAFLLTVGIICSRIETYYSLKKRREYLNSRAWKALRYSTKHRR